MRRRGGSGRCPMPSSGGSWVPRWARMRRVEHACPYSGATRGSRLSSPETCPSRVRPPPRPPRGRRLGGARARPPHEVLRRARDGRRCCLLTDRVDAAFLDGAPQLRVDRELRRRGRQHRPRGGARRRGIAGRRDARRPDRRDRRPDARAHPRRRAPAARGGARRARRRVADVGAGGLARARAARRDARDRRRRAHRAGGRRARARRFGMAVLPVRRDDAARARVLAQADVVSLHAPLTDATRHLIDAEALEAHEAHGDPRQHRARRRSSTRTRWSTRCDAGGSPAPRSTSPTPSRCRPATRCSHAPNVARRPPHRLGHPRRARADGRAGGRQPRSPASTAARSPTRRRD